MTKTTLLCSFIIDSSDFISGFECGQIWEILMRGDEVMARPIHTQSVDQINEICNALGRNIELAQSDETWWILTTTSNLPIPSDTTSK